MPCVGSYNMPCTCSLEDVSSTKLEGNCFHHESYGKASTSDEPSHVLLGHGSRLLALEKIPDIVNVKGYVDDCTAVGHCGHDLAWLLPVRRLFTDLHTAGFQIVEHSCWIAVPANTSEHGYPPAGHRKLLPPSIVQQLDHAPGHPTCLAALLSHRPRPALKWPPLIIARNKHYYCLSSAQSTKSRRAWNHGTTLPLCI